MEATKKKIGELLIDKGIIDQLHLSSALAQQRQWGGRLASILINMGVVDETIIANTLEKKLDHHCISLDNLEIPPAALNMIKHDTAIKYCVLPIDYQDRVLTVAVSDPTDLKTIDELGFVIGTKINPVLAIESSINNAIAHYYKGIHYGGRKHKIDMNKLPETMELTGNERPKTEKTIPSSTAIKALLELLIEKGLITEEELSIKIKKIL